MIIKLILLFMVMITPSFAITKVVNEQAKKPGVVSRDCLGASAKESVTVTWGGSNLVMTQSLHRINSPEKWVLLYESDWKQSWRSYAGFSIITNPLSAIQKYNDPIYKTKEGKTLKGVQGFHYWKPSQSYKGKPYRAKSIAYDCNLTEWGFVEQAFTQEIGDTHVKK